MVIPAFEVLASQEQLDNWMPKLRDFSALGKNISNKNINSSLLCSD